MLVAGVVGHEVEQDPDAPGGGLGHQPIEIVEGPEVRMDATEVGHVVAPVRVGRGCDRREPESVDAEPFEMVEVLDDTGQVAHSVAVAVGEGTQVHLVEHGVPPPGRARLDVGHARLGSRCGHPAARERFDDPSPTQRAAARRSAWLAFAGSSVSVSDSSATVGPCCAA